MGCGREIEIDGVKYRRVEPGLTVTKGQIRSRGGVKVTFGTLAYAIIQAIAMKSVVSINGASLAQVTGVVYDAAQGCLKLTLSEGQEVSVVHVSEIGG